MTQYVIRLISHEHRPVAGPDDRPTFVRDFDDEERILVTADPDQAMTFESLKEAMAYRNADTRRGRELMNFGGEFMPLAQAIQVRDHQLIVCFRCRRRPDRIPEYEEIVADGEYLDADTAVIENEGTYNPGTRRFCCTECYIAIGMPTQANTGDGRPWVAP